MLNLDLFTQIQESGKQLLLVTKYWDERTTKNILKEAETQFPDTIYGIGENRIEQIREKNILREHIHFIGNIQSQKITEIVKYCSHIHSLSSLKHAQKIESQNLGVEAFVQIKLDPEKDIGIGEEGLGVFLEACKEFQNLKIIGISGMGSAEVSEEEKRKEFQKLLSLREKYLPNGLTSARTSRDYEIALTEGIDIVRVGTALVL